MAAGAFVGGSSIELSADAPLVEPYIVYLQGGLTYEHAKLAIMAVLQEMVKKGEIELPKKHFCVKRRKAPVPCGQKPRLFPV